MTGAARGPGSGAGAGGWFAACGLVWTAGSVLSAPGLTRGLVLRRGCEAPARGPGRVSGGGEGVVQRRVTAPRSVLVAVPLAGFTLDMKVPPPEALSQRPLPLLMCQ